MSTFSRALIDYFLGEAANLRSVGSLSSFDEDVETKLIHLSVFNQDMNPNVPPSLHSVLLPDSPLQPLRQSLPVPVRHGKPDIKEGTSSAHWPLSQSRRAKLGVSRSEAVYGMVT